MEHIKSLASQTAVYGVSSILGRILSYLLVPLHTNVFSESELGPVAYFYAIGAFLLIIFTHGMETTFFRFASKKESEKSYDGAMSSVLLVSIFISFILLVFSNPLAASIDYPGMGNIVRWLVLIIMIDAVTAIPFARMRLENRARKFAVTKITIISINIGLQLLFLLLVPAMANSEGTGIFYEWARLINSWQLGIGYIFLANLVANVLLVVLIWPYFKNFKLRLDFSIIRPMMVYSFPLLLMGIAGTVTEQMDKILVKDLLSDADLGVYAQTFKLAVFILLAIQAFRYAGEPFFFSRARDKNAPELFADVLYYFILFELILYVGICLNVELIGNIMLSRPEYRVALYLVPIIMFGKLFYGIYMNLAIWYKLKDKTIYGMYFTLLGAIITVVGNLVLIPILGYTGSAITVVLAFVTMAIACYWIGRRFLPIPYRIGPSLVHILIGVIIVWASFQIKLPNVLADNALNITVSLAYILVLWFLEKGNLKKKTY